MQQKTNLGPLLSPGSIAILGASDGRDTISSVPLRLLMEHGYGGRIFPVNPRFDHIFGLECFPSLSALPENPDVLMVFAEEEDVSEIIAEGIRNKIPFIIMAPGTGKYLSKDFADSSEISSGTRIMGPDSFGFLNLKEGIPLTCYPTKETVFSSDGEIALIAQDGSLGFSFYSSARDRGIAFRYVVTTGEDTDIDCLEVGEYLLEDEHMGFLVFSFHELSNGRRFLELVRSARARGIPVAVIHSGVFSLPAAQFRDGQDPWLERSEVWDSVFQQYGVIEISGLDDLVDLGHIFKIHRRTSGPRVGILSTSSDTGMLMAEKCLREGLEVPSMEQFSGLSSHIEGYNPLSISSHHIMDGSLLSSAFEWISEQDDMDMIVLAISFIPPGTEQQVLENIIDIFRRIHKPVVCCWLPGGRNMSNMSLFLESEGMPVFSNFENCARALAALYLETTRSAALPDLPLGLDLTHELPRDLTEYHAKRFLSRYGIAITRERLCYNLEEAIEAADAIGYPVALKVMSPQIVQKSQARIIALDLRNAEEVRNAYGRTLQRAIAANPEAEIIGVLIQEMLQTGIECMISARRDPVFGPVISVGLGGIYVEFLHDHSTRIAPVDLGTAIEMVKELKGFPILKGLWGQPGYDVDSLARVVSQVSEILCVEDGLSKISINPVFVRETGTVIVDAFMIRG